MYLKIAVIFRKATSEMARRMLEEHTYFCMLYMNWQRDDVWERFGPVLLADVPAPIRPMIMNLARGSVLRDLHGQVWHTCFFSFFPLFFPATAGQAHPLIMLRGFGNVVKPL